MQKKIKILDIFPDIYTEDWKLAKKEREELSKFLNEQTNGLVQLDLVFVEKGGASIEGAFDIAVNTPYILQKVKWAEKDHYDAVVIDCFDDPGLEAAREIVTIPVVSANQSACFLASELGQRFSIINVVPEVEVRSRYLLRKYGIIDNLASIRTINVPVLDLEKNYTKVLQAVVDAAKKAVIEDGAHVIVFGCTGMAVFLKEVKTELEKEGLNVPIIEPLRAAIYDAIRLVLMGVSHSKMAYRVPREKLRVLDFEI